MLDIDNISFDYNFNPQILSEAKKSKIYVIDDFYKEPHNIASFIYNTPKRVHKGDEHPSYNMLHFRDERHCLYSQKLNPLIKDIEDFTDTKFKDFNSGGNFFTNCQMWYDNQFNNFKDNYWWPHLDYGWTAIVYLNKDENSGTNLYEKSDDFYNQEKTKEHLEPWRSKDLWNKIYTIPSKYNRLVLFHAGDLFHGVDINSNIYSNNYRINQVMFFEE
jgi:hypothetical protein